MSAPLSFVHVGLTGNVGAGKSTVAAHFAARGAVCIDADRIVRELQEPGTPVHAAILRRFGPAVVSPGGTLDRAALRRRILEDPGAKADLEAIVHPAVAARRAALIEEARAAGAAVVVSEIPLLFETMDPASFDAVVFVDAPAEVRRERLVRTRGLTPEEADALMNAQAPAEPKRRRSDFVIENARDLDTLARAAEAVWARLRPSGGA